MRNEAKFYFICTEYYLKKHAVRFYRGEMNAGLLHSMFHIFTSSEVASITGRESSTVRYARLSGSLFGVKRRGRYYYNLWEIKRCFPVKRRVNRTWSSEEVEELIRTGACRGRSSKACKTMKSKIRNNKYVIR